MTALDEMLIGRLLVAALLGSVIGFDRERLGWAPGLRTHMLVCVGACLFMLVSAYGFAEVLNSNAAGPRSIILDPSRIAAQVVSGIGFLGAGTILLRGEMIRGLTTAASLWSVAAIGLAVGGGLYIEAVAATVIILIILAGIKPIEAHFQKRHLCHRITLEAKAGALSPEALEAALGGRGGRITRYVARPGAAGQEMISVTLTHLSPREVGEAASLLKALPGVSSVSLID